MESMMRLRHLVYGSVLITLAMLLVISKTRSAKHNEDNAAPPAQAIETNDSYKQITSLNNRLNRLERAQGQLSGQLIKNEAENQERIPDRTTPIDREKASREWFQSYFSQLDQRRELEPADPSFAATFRSAASAEIQPGKKLEINSVKCGSTLCRIEGKFDSDVSMSDKRYLVPLWIGALSNEAPEASVDSMGNDGKIVAYFARNGNHLP